MFDGSCASSSFSVASRLGTLIVIFNSARLVRKGEELEHFHPEMEKLERPASGQLTPKLA